MRDRLTTVDNLHNVMADKVTDQKLTQCRHNTGFKLTYKSQRNNLE